MVNVQIINNAIYLFKVKRWTSVILIYFTH